MNEKKAVELKNDIMDFLYTRGFPVEPIDDSKIKLILMGDKKLAMLVVKEHTAYNQDPVEIKRVTEEAVMNASQGGTKNG